jgi:hypothetical protein
MTMTWAWLRRIDARVALGGALTWGVMYLGFGPADTLQREFLILVPTLAGMLIFFAPLPPLARYFASGLAFGVVATMKPQAAIGFPFLLLLDWYNQRSEGEAPRVSALIRALVPAAAGVLLPVTIALLWVWRSGGLAPLLEIMANYWPLYGRLGDDHQTLSGGDRISYLIRQYRSLGGYGTWLAPAVLGGFIALYATRIAPRQRQFVVALLVLTFAYSLYPLFSGQFWRYHWFLLGFFLTQASALCLLPASAEGEAPRSARPLFAPAVLAFVIITLTPLGIVREALVGARAAAVKDGRVDAIAQFLQQRLRPGDTVQPLDWTAGAVHAMLIARAPIATRFIYDFHFYHHVSQPYIQTLREEFVRELTRTRPRFLIQMTTEDKPWPSGRDTTRRFEALEALIAEGYVVALEGRGFRILERNPGA